ncbi:TlyA family RNA methyltransferase [Streptomyces sp. B1866]|uniref:TlyA family RNA methyltransferase n=1 Tax=Streptomyces sp. B1866 TaxID=3075431 RepID=UPI0028916DFF|nr:TlyA family RNA methyltransferase [Streptomyces sp. B1866]MDT3397165.1 TlyA family RNA methyltransferase [Streptomyces sp. B1866]
MTRPRRARLDAELVRRGLARSREHAGRLIAEGRVSVGGQTATKAATQVETGAALLVAEDAGDPGYVSRGGHKLAGALRAFSDEYRRLTQDPAAPAAPAAPEALGARRETAARPAGGLRIAGRRALDAGASTGGFTDVLLRAGAAHVVAVDVGYGQLAWSLRADDRVTVRDRTNVRELTLEHVGGEPVDLVVGDLSFIPLGLVLPALARCAAPDADLVLMVKPQFEVGRERLGSGGVVRSPELRAEAVRTVARRAAELGLGVLGVTASPLPGPSGNVEYFLWMRAGAPDLDPADVDRAVAEGPR